MSFLNNLLGDSRLGGILALVIGLCVLGLIAIYVFRAVGRGVRSNGSRSPRQPRLGIVDAFDLDRHRQLVLVRRDNVEHLIMIGGPNDLLIEGAIVRAQPAGLEGRREPGLAGQERGNERAAPRLAIEAGEEGRAEPTPPRPEPVRAETSRPEPLRAEPRAEPARGMMEPRPTPDPAPSLRPAIEPAAAAPEPMVPPPPPLARPASPAFPNRPAPPPPRPLPPLRPVTPNAAAGSKLPPPPIPGRAAPPPPPPPVVAAPAQPASAPATPPAPEARPESPAVEPPPRFAVNIDSLEEEMAKLLGRPPGNKS